MKLNEVEYIEIGLVNKCQLKCPLCTRNKKIFNELDKFNKPHELDYGTLISFLDKLINLETINLVGATTEPFLYYRIEDLICYIKKRNVNVIISTNGMSDIDFEKINNVLTKTDKIKWGIDGSTQKIYKKYRRGGNLKKVLNNKSKLENAYNVLQFILFKHNESDLDDIKKLSIENKFDDLLIENCYDFNKDNYDEYDIDIKPIEIIEKLYKTLKSRRNIVCNSIEGNEIYLNYTGEIFPCCHLDEENIRSEVNINNNNQIEIENHITEVTRKKEYNSCGRFCSKMNSSLFKQFNVDP